MDLEDQMCREPLAWMLNHIIPGGCWISEANAGLRFYESGRPDGFAMPWMLPIECKADRGSLYTGDPDKPARKAANWQPGDTSPEKRGFHTAQRAWLERVCRKPGAHVLYYLALWMNPATEGRIDHSLDRFFLVNVDAWLDMEYVAVTRFDTRSVPLNQNVTRFMYRRELNVERWFGAYALQQYHRTDDKGRKAQAWHIPAAHPLWDDLHSHHQLVMENLDF